MNTQGGFAKFVIIFVAMILLMSALRINLYGKREATSEGALVTNWQVVKAAVIEIWTNYIVRPVKYVWQEYVIPFVTGKFLHKLKERQIEQSTLPEDNLATST